MCNIKTIVIVKPGFKSGKIAGVITVGLNLIDGSIWDGIRQGVKSRRL